MCDMHRTARMLLRENAQDDQDRVRVGHENVRHAYILYKMYGMRTKCATCAGSARALHWILTGRGGGDRGPPGGSRTACGASWRGHGAATARSRRGHVAVTSRSRRGHGAPPGGRRCACGRRGAATRTGCGTRGTRTCRPGGGPARHPAGRPAGSARSEPARVVLI